ncbi:MAG: Na+/H+ antiporter [Candidatus Dasytiphilus stammeri]
MDIFLNILILMVLVSLSGIIKRIIPYQLPLPLLQISMGSIIAWPKFGFHMNFNSELFMILFIPPLLFVDGWKTPPSEFIKHGREIVALALILVVLTVVIIGYLIYWIVPEMPLLPAFCLAAVLSPTDAVALSGIIGEARIPKKIRAILQGEALTNDASSLVALKIAVAVSLGEMAFTFSGAIIEFIKIFIGGITAGIVITLLYGKALRSMSRWTEEEDPVTEIIGLFLLPFACSFTADCIDLSGILAAGAAGMTVSKSGIIHHAPLSMRLRANSVWSMLEFLFNGIVFILFGLQLPKIIKNTLSRVHMDTSINLGILFLDIVCIYIALLLLRFSWLLTMQYISSHFFTRHPLEFSKYNLRELLTASFAGVRGAITLAGVLSIPHFINFNQEFPARYELIFLSTGVILFSLFIAMIVLPFLLRGVSTLDTFILKHERQKARSVMAQVAIESLYKMQDRLISDTTENIDSELIKEVTSRVIGNLRRRLLDTDQNIDEILFLDNLERRFLLTSLRAERGELYHLRATQKISDETMQKLLYELDLIEALLRENQ